MSRTTREGEAYAGHMTAKSSFGLMASLSKINSVRLNLRPGCTDAKYLRERLTVALSRARPFTTSSVVGTPVGGFVDQCPHSVGHVASTRPDT